MEEVMTTNYTLRFSLVLAAVCVLGASSASLADNAKSPNQPSAAVGQKAESVDGNSEGKAKKPSYPGPGVETWLGKRFPPPAPVQPAMKSPNGG
jgi:hypothetical protein